MAPRVNQDQALTSHHQSLHISDQCRKFNTRCQRLHPRAHRPIRVQMPGIIHPVPQSRPTARPQDQRRRPSADSARRTWSSRVKTGGAGMPRRWAWAWRIGAGRGVRRLLTPISSMRIITAISCQWVSIPVLDLFPSISRTRVSGFRI